MESLFGLVIIILTASLAVQAYGCYINKEIFDDWKDRKIQWSKIKNNQMPPE